MKEEGRDLERGDKGSRRGKECGKEKGGNSYQAPLLDSLCFIVQGLQQLQLAG